MIKVVKIGDKDVTLKTSAALPHIYRRTFNRDIFLDMTKMSQSVTVREDGTSELHDPAVIEMFEDMAYCFAKHADPDVPDDPMEWFAQFEMFDIYKLIPVITDMWNGERKTTSKIKKKSAAPQEK